MSNALIEKPVVALSKEDEDDLLVAEAMIEQKKKLIGRECGECSLCCRLFPVPELNKPANIWCEHCQPGKGCTIYDRRPPICRGFACGWLLGHMSDKWFPKRAGMVIKAFHKVHGGQTQMTIVVDPRAPNKWREQPFLDDIRRLAHLGLSGEYDFDFQTVVRIGRHRYLILPHGEIDISNADDDSECLLVMA